MLRPTPLLALALCCLTLAACRPSEVSAPVAEPIPALLQWELSESSPLLLAKTESEQLIAIDVEAVLPDDFDQRRHVNVSVVVDHSGSMNGPQMHDAREAVVALLAEIRPDDTVSIVAFSSRVTTLLPQTRWGDVDEEALIASVRALEPTGTTAMVEGLAEGYSQIMSRYESEAINRILLFSDGEANDPAQLPAMADQARTVGVSITTMGLGAHFNEEMLALLADRSGGRYRFIEKSEEMRSFFLAEIIAMQQMVASNAFLTFTLGPNVRLIEGFGGQFTVSGNQVFVQLGDLSAGDARSLALKLHVTAGGAGAQVEVLDARLAWTDAVFGTWQSMELVRYLGVQASGDEAEVERAQNTSIVEAVGRMQASWEVAQAINMVQAGETDRGRELLLDAAERYRANGQPMAIGQEVSFDAFIEETAYGLQSAPADEAVRLNLKRVQSQSRSMSGL